MTRRILSAPAGAPAKNLLLAVHRGQSLYFYAFRGTTPVPLPESVPESLPLASAAEGKPAVYEPDRRAGYECRLCLSAESVLYRTWHFPFSGTGKIRQALQLALASELPFPDTELEHALCIQKAPTNKRHTLAISASVKKRLLTDIRHALSTVGLVPGCITFDPFPALEGTTAEAQSSLDVFVRADHAVLLRREHGAITSIQVTGTGWCDLCPADGERRAQFVEMARKFGPAQAFSQLGLMPDTVLSAALRNTLHEEAQAMPHTPPDMPLNVHAEIALAAFSDDWPLSGVCGDPVEALAHMRRPLLSLPAERARKGTGYWKTAAVLYAFAVCAALFALWGETRFQERRAAHLEQTATRLFRATLPELSSRSFGSVQMESILRQRIADRQAAFAPQGGASVVALLEAVHRATPAALDVRVNTIRVNLTRKDSGLCALSCTAPDYETAGRFKEALEALPEVDSALVRNAVQTTAPRAGAAAQRGVQFELELRLKQGNS